MLQESPRGEHSFGVRGGVGIGGAESITGPQAACLSPDLKLVPPQQCIFWGSAPESDIRGPWEGPRNLYSLHTLCMILV